MDEPNDAQRAMVEGLFRGTVCPDCGEDIVPTEPCEACAEKRELLRQTFPKLHGDA